MIVSYKHNFVFWKPTKVGGTSVLQALGAHCGQRDVVCQPTDLEGHPGYGRNMKKVASNNHATPAMIIEFLNLSQRRWSGFFKFTIVRNPWDECVSRFWHAVRRGKFRLNAEDVSTMSVHDIKTSFRSFLCGVRDANQAYYFDDEGRPLADFYIRFERLSRDYGEVCRRLMLPVNPLPRMKSDFKLVEIPIYEYYDQSSIQMVRDRFSKRIDYFEYAWAGESDTQ